MRYLKYLILIGIGAFFCNAEVRADSSIYTVDVSVDVTDVNASKARERAMLAANRKAFETVVGKLTTSQNAASMFSMTDDMIVNFIKEVSIVSEKSSNIRYIADLRVTLSEAILKAYMSEKDIHTVVTTRSKVTIIPVFREFEADKPVLWEDNNIWRKAWENKLPRNSLVEINSLKPMMQDIDAEEALALDGGALRRVALNNNANDVYVADAVFDGIDGLKIKISSMNGDSSGETISVPGDRNDSDDLFARAIDEVCLKIENKIKAVNIAESQTLSSIEVVFHFNSISEWVRIEKQLKSIAYVRELQIVAMGSNKVQFKLEFVGGDDKIWAAFREKGFNLKDYGDFYLLEK